MTVGLPCKYGDPLCPCQDGMLCHYEGKNPMSSPILQQVTIVEILPTRIWIENDVMGARHVVMHHQDFGEPFTYATFHYEYGYTSNSGTWDQANTLALALGATEPVEHRPRELSMPTADELREQIEGLQGLLADMDRGKG